MLDTLMRETMDQFTTAWAAVDIDALMALFGENPIYHTSSGTVFHGRAALREGLAVMCQPPPPGHVAPPPVMTFFGNQCVSYWTLDLPGNTGSAIVKGVDIITFDDRGRLIMKDAYRKIK